MYNISWIMGILSYYPSDVKGQTRAGLVDSVRKYNVDIFQILFSTESPQALILVGELET